MFCLFLLKYSVMKQKNFSKAPIQRSLLRRILGRVYFWCRRIWYWHMSGRAFATSRSTKLLPHRVFSHKTVLLRKLKDVDMWMQHNKVVNLNIATQKIDGLVIRPGETFSFWRQVGNTTTRKGYVSGMELFNGTVRSGVGGGLCQLSNLVYWMTLHTPLDVVERWRHGYDVFPDVHRTQPFGSGATCSYPNIDLQIQNNTPHTFQLSTCLSDTHLVGSWHCSRHIKEQYEIYEKEHSIAHEVWGGYTRSYTLYRKVVDVDTKQLLNDYFVVENNAIMMYTPFLKE